MYYLFQVTIGPIQDFIASSRRTRDLWFGSTLLSELSKVAANTIVGSHTLDSLIFPAPASKDKLAPNTDLKVANKILATFEGTDEEVRALGRAVWTAIDEQLQKISQTVFTAIEKATEKRDDPEAFNKEAAMQQIQALVEYSWVALPYEEPEYIQARKNVEALMAARKNTRTFHPVDWGSSEAKSSIDGQLESVISNKSYPRTEDHYAIQAVKTKSLYRRFRAGPSEHLSGVDLLKRRGTFPGTQQTANQAASSEAELANQGVVVEDFLSTSHIAALPYLEGLQNRLSLVEQQQARAYWYTYIEKLQKLTASNASTIKGPIISPVLEFIPGGRELERPIINALLQGKELRPHEEQEIKKHGGHSVLGYFDGGLLFEQRLLQDTYKSADFREITAPLQDFLGYVGTALGKNVEPSTYYAIIHADGDRMGEMIDRQEDHQKHRELSRALDIFALEAKEIVNEHRGALVYAGGDDVLAFVPLHTALFCARALARSFAKHMKQDAFQIERGNGPTLSVGIAIVHHLSLLQESLNIARDAEKRAKKVDGKNALAITISKRSGEDYTVADHWGALDTYLERLIGYFYNDYLPRGIAYELRDMALRLTMQPTSKAEPKPEHPDLRNDKEKNEDADLRTLQEIMRVDAGRILRRKLYLPQSKLSLAQQKRQGAADQQADPKALELWTLLMARLGKKEQPDEKIAAQTTEARSRLLKEIASITPVAIEEFINELIVAQELADAWKLIGREPEGDAVK